MPGSTVGTGNSEVGPADVALELVLDDIQPSPAHLQRYISDIYSKGATLSKHCEHGSKGGAME